MNITEFFIVVIGTIIGWELGGWLMSLVLR